MLNWFALVSVVSIEIQTTNDEIFSPLKVAFDIYFEFLWKKTRKRKNKL